MNDPSMTLAAPTRTDPAGTAPAQWVARYRAVRRETERLCEPLVCEDYIVQSMSDVSPTKWHLAHTSWFFETFLLAPHAPGYAPYNPHFAYLFNSYYVALGDRHCRQNRGLLSRPTVAEVYDYRRHVDEALARLLPSLGEEALAAVAPALEIGLNHEQQHRELILTDIKHVFWVNPLRPAYRPRVAPADGPTPAMRWVDVDGGLHWVGHDDRGGGGGGDFAFDNEAPRHRVFLEPFRLGSRLVTNGEYKDFIADGGYRRGELWLSLGWATAQADAWGAPLYWIWDGRWLNHTLSGLRPVDDAEPVCHVSYFEADAYARWAGARLPTEQEWEVASAAVPVAGNLADAGVYHPAPAPAATATATATATAGREGPAQMFGDAWEWTASGYLPYPGYRPPPGALGEYNGKFMCNQFVLRGGSCATPAGHVRRTYRNFFPPDVRWQFTGVRLARDA